MEIFSEGISLEDFWEMLDEITLTLPQEIFKNLNGGVNLLPDVRLHPQNKELFVLGQYHYGGSLGRYINIYYGSFMKLYGNRSARFLKKELEKVLRHEFLHHLESMAGERELEIKDEIELAKYTEG